MTEMIAPAFGVFFASRALDALLLVWITGTCHCSMHPLHCSWVCGWA